MNHHQEADDDLSQAADLEVDHVVEVDLDPAVIDQVVVDHDPYHQQNIKSNVILAIAKIPHDRDVLAYSILVDEQQKMNFDEFLNVMVV